MFFLSVCIGPYATFSVISKSTVVDSITVSYTGWVCWYVAVVPSGSALDADSTYLRHKRMQAMTTTLTAKKTTAEMATDITMMML